MEAEAILEITISVPERRFLKRRHKQVGMGRSTHRISWHDFYTIEVTHLFKVSTI